MNKPTAFLHCSQQDLSEQLINLPALKQFVLARSNELLPWYQDSNEQNYDLVLVDVDRQTEKELSELSLDSNSEVLFFSDGRPNPRLDSMMKSGAGYHFRTPYDFDAINHILEDLAEELQSPLLKTQKAITSDLDQFGQLVGSSRPMHKLYRAVRRVAATDANVLVVGESGTGKELVANTVHIMSPRSEKPLVAINCGALSPELVDSELFGHVKGAFTGANKDHAGVFAQAKGGTLFLDEVTEMPIEQQVKLLRVLEQEEYKPVGSDQVFKADVRIIAACNRDPFEAIEQGQLREDLYFRLAQFPISVPTLRERGNDIKGLAKHFVAYLNQTGAQNIRIAEEALEKIEKHTWPGNVRELKHCVERAFILTEDIILAEHIELHSVASSLVREDQQDVPTGVPLEDIEKLAITQTLEENDGNKTETADQLGISVKTLYNKLEKYQDKP